MKTVTELHFFFFLVWSSFTSLYSLNKVKSNLIISYTINHSMGTVCPQKILVTSNSFPRARIIQNNQLSLSSEMIDKTITKFCWGYCSKSDFFISNSGILQLIQKVQFHLSSLGKDHFMCHWMERNQLSCCFGHFLKSFTKPFLEETRYRHLHPEKNEPFCMLMLHSNRSSKAEVFSEKWTLRRRSHKNN